MNMRCIAASAPTVARLCFATRVQDWSRSNPSLHTDAGELKR